MPIRICNRSATTDVPDEEKKINSVTTVTAGNAAFLLENPVEGLNIFGVIERFGDGASWLEAAKRYIMCTPDLLTFLGIAGAADPDIYRITIRGIKNSSYAIAADKTGMEAEELEEASRCGDIEFIRSHSAKFLADTKDFVSRLKDLIERADTRAYI
jgi:hypothetical protein